jgi:hypothetical protein
MQSKKDFWKNYSWKGALLLTIMYFITTILLDKLADWKEWKDVFTKKNIFLKITGSIVFGIVMEYVFVKWGKKSDGNDKISKEK